MLKRVVVPFGILLLLACAGGDPPAATETPVVAVPQAETVAPPAEPAPVLLLDGKPTKAAFDKAYADIFQTSDAIQQPWETKLAAFIAQVGTPPRAEGGKQVWYAVGTEHDCFKVELSEEGMGKEKIFDKAMAQAECGLAPTE